MRFRRLLTDRHPRCVLQVPSWPSWDCFPEKASSVALSFPVERNLQLQESVISLPCSCYLPPPPPALSAHSRVPRGNNFSSFTVLTAGPLSVVAGSILVASFDSWRALATKSECAQLRVQMGKEGSLNTIQRGRGAVMSETLEGVAEMGPYLQVTSSSLARRALGPTGLSLPSVFSSKFRLQH